MVRRQGVRSVRQWAYGVHGGKVEMGKLVLAPFRLGHLISTNLIKMIPPRPGQRLT